MKSFYAVFVADANGWDRDCPSSEDVFFGRHGGKFVRWPHDLENDDDARLKLGQSGFVIVEGFAAAISLRNELDETGDWVVRSGEEKNVETRPTYRLRKLSGRYA